jgi:hypothetical protein
MASCPAQGAWRVLMRAYFLDDTIDLPEAFNLYLWPFKANYQVILNKIAIQINGEIVKGDFLKYFPVAFWLTYQAPDSIKRSMSGYELPVRGRGIDDESTIMLTVADDGIRSTWPEFPGDNEIVCIDVCNCIVAVPAG